MTDVERGLTIGASIAARRVARMPCICDARSDGCQLLAQSIRGGTAIERIACACGRIWRRVWVGGYG